MRRAACLVPLLLLTACAAWGDGGIDADRPDFTNGPRALEAGRWQLEAGGTRVSVHGEDALGLGEGLLRHGLAPGWELRLALPSWSRAGEGAARTSGLGDAGAGFKLTLPGATEDFAAGVIGDVTLPTGARDVGGGTAGGDLALAMTRAVGARLDATFNAGAAHQSGENTVLVSTSWGLDLGGRWGTWAEWAAIAGWHGTAHRFDTGVTCALTRDLQLDARVGAGAGDAQGEVTVGAGVAVRW